MQEIPSQNHTDKIENKIQLLTQTYSNGDLDVALSLVASLRDSLVFEKQIRQNCGQITLDAKLFHRIDELPAGWAQWANGWKYYKILTLQERVGLARLQEPMEIGLGLLADQTTNPYRDLRLAKFDQQTNSLHEIPCQVEQVVRSDSQYLCRMIFCADTPSNGCTTYLIFYGNPCAELPQYTTDLRVSGEGFALDIENHHYLARLSPQMGQLERLTFKRDHGLELFAGGEGHGEPPNIDWAHDYMTPDQSQKFRVTNWATCPNHEVTRGPLCTKVRRWGFPHSPIHPVFTQSRLNIDVTYTFYAGAPYFRKSANMTAVKDFEIDHLRDDEWVFSGYSFTDSLWIDCSGNLHEGDVPQQDQNNLWGVGFFNRETRDAFITLWLKHEAENFDGICHSGAPIMNYPPHGHVWSRWAARDHPKFKTGASIKQENAYIVLPYLKKGGAEQIQEMRMRLLNPLVASQSNALPPGIDAKIRGSLAREGESEEAIALKRIIWDSLRSIRDEMLYSIDANIVDMGYIYDLRVRHNTVYILMTMPHRGRPKFGFIAGPIREQLMKLDHVDDVIVDLTWEPAWTVSRLSESGRKQLGLPNEE